MKYEVGDDILVLHSNEEGKVVEIINEKMVMIEVRGVKFPAYMDQIDFPYFKRFTEKKLVVPKKAPKVYVDQVPKEKGQPNSIKVADGVWLSLIPKFALDDFNDEVVELFKIHLVNRTEKALKFQYTQSFLGDPAFEFSDNPVFRFVFELVTPEKGKAKWYETETRIKAKQLFKRIEEMKEANEPMLSYSLFKDFPAEQVEEKFELTGLAAKGFKVYEAKEARKHLAPARSVIDLHMEKLMDNWQSLPTLEILGIQLAEFEKYYELAIAHHQPSLIVIHGVGTGRLRDEIHDLLKGRKEVRYFVNQYDARFGYGATEIFFQY